MHSKKLIMIALFVLANVLGFNALTNAGTVVMNFDNEIDVDGDPPAGSPPWLIATFADNGTDAVLLTIQSTLQSQIESIKRLWFNTADGIDADNLNIVQREGGPTAISILSQQDGFGGTSDEGHSTRGYDLELKWNALAFVDSDVVQFDISGSGLTAESFNTKNNLGDFYFFSIAKIGGVEDKGNEHNGNPHDELIAPTGIPLPNSLLLGAMGLIALPLIVSRWGRMTA